MDTRTKNPGFEHRSRPGRVVRIAKKGSSTETWIECKKENNAGLRTMVKNPIGVTFHNEVSIVVRPLFHLIGV